MCVQAEYRDLSQLWVDDLDLLKQLRDVCVKNGKNKKYFDSSAFASTIRAWADAFDLPDLPTELGMGTSASASASARGSRRASSDMLWQPKSIRTRGPDEWDPAVNMINWLSQRGSGGPPPRLRTCRSTAARSRGRSRWQWSLTRRSTLRLRAHSQDRWRPGPLDRLV